jgi:hypothetical protein
MLDKIDAKMDGLLASEELQALLGSKELQELQDYMKDIDSNKP